MVLIIFVIMATKVKSAKSKTSGKETLKPEIEEKVAVKQLLKDERTHKIAGTVFLLISFLLFIAFSSYLFTWDEDQDKFSYRMLLANDIKVQNLLGTFGAFISEIFIRHGFGIASYLICTFFFVVGVNLFFEKKVFSVPRNIKYLIIGLPLLSVTASVIMKGNKFPFGGSAGDTSREWLYRHIGQIGTLAVLAVAVLGYVIWRFNPVFKLPSKPGFVAEEDDEQEGANESSAIEATATENAESRGNMLKGNGGMLPIQNPYDPALNHDIQIVEKDIPLVISKQQEDGDIAKEIPLNNGEELIIHQQSINIRQAKKEEQILPLELEIKTIADMPDKEDKPSSTIKHQTVDTPYDPILDLRDYKYQSLNYWKRMGAKKLYRIPMNWRPIKTRSSIH